MRSPCRVGVDPTGIRATGRGLSFAWESNNVKAPNRDWGPLMAAVLDRHRARGGSMRGLGGTPKTLGGVRFELCVGVPMAAVLDKHRAR
eukprot:1785998-Prorocentrum_lima.AAC.1